MTNTNQGTKDQAIETTNEIISAIESQDVAKADSFSPSVFENAASAEVMFSSIVQDGSRETAIKQYSAVSDAENAISEHIGEVIEIEHMVAHSIKMQDDQTGETIEALRVVLITPEGEGYHSVAQGVVSSLQRIIGIVGQAPWTPALRVVPVEKKTRKGFKTLTLKLV